MSSVPTVPVTLTPVGPALAAAAVTAALGFGVLNIFELSGMGEVSLPGLYTFRSATIGDGLLLPLLAYALVRAAGLQSGWQRGELRVIAGVAAAGALGGVVLQASWLWNPSPRLNWTLTAPHTFNLAGWYHAGFLVVACGFFAAAGTAVLLRVRAEVRQGLDVAGRLRSLSALGVFAPGPAFIGLVLQDNDAPFPVWALGVVVACFAAGLLTLWSMRFVNPIRSLPAFGASVAVGIGVCGLFVERFNGDAPSALAVAAAGFGGAFAASALGARGIGERISLAALAALCGAGAANAALAADLPPLAAALWATVGSAALVAVMVLAARCILPGDHAPPQKMILVLAAAQPLVAFGVAGVFVARTGESYRPYAGVVAAVAAAFILALTARAVRDRFDVVIDAEVHDGPTSRLSALKWAAYLAIATAFASAMSAFLGFVLGTTAADSWITDVPTEPADVWRPAAVVASVLVVLVLSRSARNLVGPRAAVSFVVCASGVAWCAALVFELAAGYHSFVQAMLSIFVAVTAGLFVLEGIIGNTTVLHNVRIGGWVRVVAGVHAAAAALTIAWLTGPPLPTPTEFEHYGPRWLCWEWG